MNTRRIALVSVLLLALVGGAVGIYLYCVAEPSEIHVEVTQAWVENQLNDILPVLRSIRATPYNDENGKFIGMQILGMTDDSPLHSVGVQDEDVLLQLGTIVLDAPSKVMDAFSDIHGKKQITAVMLRKGRRVQIHYDLK